VQAGVQGAAPELLACEGPHSGLAASLFTTLYLGTALPLLVTALYQRRAKLAWLALRQGGGSGGSASAAARELQQHSMLLPWALF
jgi:hypothetical protein